MMRKNVIVNEYSVRIDYYDKDGGLELTEIEYDGGDTEWIRYRKGQPINSFYYPSNNRPIKGYDYYYGEKIPIGTDEFEQFL